MQEASSGREGWQKKKKKKKKSKIAVEEGAAMKAGSAAREGFNNLEENRSYAIDDSLNGFGSDNDGDEEQKL